MDILTVLIIGIAIGFTLRHLGIKGLRQLAGRVQDYAGMGKKVAQPNKIEVKEKING